MKLSVLQWNVWFKEEISRVLNFLLKNKADIICLQELTCGYVDQTQENTWDYLAHELGYDYHYKDMPIITDTEEWFQGNATFSRFPIEHRHSDWINEPLGEGGFEDEYRVYLETSILAGDKILTVANTHMSFTDNFLTTKRKLDETRRLMQFIGEDKSAYVLCGDFNAEPNSDVTKSLLAKLKNAGPDFAQNTWTTKPFSYGGFEAKTLDWRLDYIFVSNDVEVESAQIIKTDISDHLPIMAKLEIG